MSGLRLILRVRLCTLIEVPPPRLHDAHSLHPFVAAPCVHLFMWLMRTILIPK